MITNNDAPDKLSNNSFYALNGVIQSITKITMDEK